MGSSQSNAASTLIRTCLALFVLGSCALLAAPAAAQQTFYVDAATGNDNNDGLTPGTAWRTLARANAMMWPEGCLPPNCGNAVGAGDTVRLRGTFTGQRIEPQASGTAGAPITFESDPAILPAVAELVGGEVSANCKWLLCA